MKKRNSRQTPKRCANYLPKVICNAFESEFVDLIDQLPSDPRVDYLKAEYRSKYLDNKIVSADIRRANAIQKWMTVEVKNRTINQNLLFDEDLGYVTSDELIKTARLTIHRVLGSFDSETVFKNGSHTNGASTRVRRSPKAAILKHLGKAHLTSSAIKHWLAFAHNTQLSKQTLELNDASVLFTVDKASDIDRVACKEPECNMLLQRCVGSFIRSKLLSKVGINLNDQSINQRLAKEAYFGDLATIDLSSASDSISRTLVMRLLPAEWWSVLDDLRSDTINIDGTDHVLEMFSSMGNGFTFELESLIFYALTRAIAYHSGVKGKISVYGDDIIAPRKLGPRIKRTFSFFGFKVNSKKSNWSGSFRESCGKHYYKSLDVTPFYLRESIRSKTDVIRMLNRLLQWDSNGLFCLTTESVITFHYKWAQQIPHNLHGGSDPNMDNCLVTGDPPRSALLQKMKKIPYDYNGALLRWYTERGDDLGITPPWKTVVEPLFSDPRIEGKYVILPRPLELRRTRWWPYQLMEQPLVHT
jgi:hypothetical protein